MSMLMCSAGYWEGQQMSEDVLRAFMDGSSDTPWDALRYLVAEVQM